MVSVVEFQTAGEVAALRWETQCRFVLDNGHVIPVYLDEPFTREEVEELLADVSDSSGHSLEDGMAFLSALQSYDDGSRYARMSPIHEMDRALAMSTTGMVAVDAERDPEEPVELIGRLIREAVAGI